MRLLNREVKTSLEIQRSRIRHPGESRDPATSRLSKALDHGFRRDDEYLGISASRAEFSPGSSVRMTSKGYVDTDAKKEKGKAIALELPTQKDGHLASYLSFLFQFLNLDI